MPADHRLRLNYRESVQHAGHQPIQPGKYQTVDAGEGSSLRRFTSQHVELMTKRQDLYLQRRSRPEQSDQRQPNQAANISHQPRASPNSPPLASRFEFPTMTGANRGDHLKTVFILYLQNLRQCPAGGFSFGKSRTYLGADAFAPPNVGIEAPFARSTSPRSLQS